MRGAIHRRAKMRAVMLCAPGTLWIAFLLLVPLAGLLAVSFCGTGDYGEIERTFTTEHYRRFAGFGAFGWEPLYPVIIARSLWVAGVSTMLCLVLSLPLAFAMAALPARWKNAALVLVTIPLWTNLLIRTYAWQMLLDPGPVAVFAGMVCDYLPFFALPLYASVEKIDWTLAEAAQDLGATRWRVFRHAVLPQIGPGMIAGGVLVFVPATGQFIIPDLLGGAKTVLLGNVVQQQFGASRNWPFGSAVTAAAMILVLAGLRLHARASARAGTNA
jgi:spermidine/putrescine transport system permease protein